MLGASTAAAQASWSTSHMRLILRLMASGMSRSARSTSASGWMPTWRSAATECWVGLVFSSPLGARYGTSETWRKKTLSRPRSWRTCRAASRKGSDSMSPTVPPISVMMTSGASASATPGDPAACARIRSLSSLVMCGMTCTVSPRNSPRRSFWMTRL